MDFYEALMKYEKIFGDILKKNLEKFKNKLNEIVNKKYSKNDENKNNEFDNIENKNIKEIIKEIETSNKLKNFIQLNNDKTKKNKCIIFAKDVKKKENRNYNNQKRIINKNDINKNELNDEEITKMIKEIKEKMANKIKENYLNEINKNFEKNKNPNLTQNDFSNVLERKINYSITDTNLSKSRDSRNIISITQRNNKSKFKTPINIITKTKKSVNYLNDIGYIPNNDEDGKIKSNFNIFKNNQRIITEENKDENNKKIHIKNIKINNGIENIEKNNNKNKEERPISNKKIEISKFKIGNNEYKLKNNNNNNQHKNNKKMKNNNKHIVKIKPRPETEEINHIDKNKIKIHFNKKRILSSRMIIKEEDKIINN